MARSGRLSEVSGDKGQSGVLFPRYVDTKTGRSVMEVLREKHLEMRIPDLTDPE